jgi:hypothetical protein
MCLLFLQLLSILSFSASSCFSLFLHRLKEASTCQGRIQDFKLGGEHLKKLRRVEGGAKIFGVFRVKHHDFTPKKSYFFRLRREVRTFLGYFVWKITILRQKIIFFPILGGARAGCASPWIRPCLCGKNQITKFVCYFILVLCWCGDSLYSN